MLGSHSYAPFAFLLHVGSTPLVLLLETRQPMNSSRRELRGVLPVFQTPYHADETLDLVTLEQEIAWLYDCGADGIVMAMVSEVLRLASEERESLAEAACKFGRSRGVVIISVGAESSKVAERYAK